MPTVMREEVRKQAEKKVEAKMSFYISSIVFFFVTIILLLLSTYLPGIRFWLLLPIPIFVMVLAILYLVSFGFPASVSSAEDWREAEIQKEMAKLRRQKAQPLTQTEEELPAAESLELKELEHLRDKRNWNEDLV
jgi:hypothetical protein